MTIRVEDTVRNNLVLWTIEAHSQSPGVAGAILNTFASPVQGNGYKQSVQTSITRLHNAGLEVWLDPMTHVLQMPSIGDFRYYDEWDLWSGSRGLLDTATQREEHIQRVFAIQDGLDLPRLAPTILLHTPQSSTSQRALEMAEFAVSQGPCILSVVGDSSFWSSDALDAHIGALAQLEPSGWTLGVARASAQLPVIAAPGEVAGLARTALALSEYAPVHISHGDLAALSAVAVGASSIGTGWDPRQRVLAYPTFASRDPDAEGGGWFKRVTYEGLFGLLTQGDAQILNTADAGLSQRLLPGAVIPPGPKETFMHHVAVIERQFARRIPDARQDALRLRAEYVAATASWSAVVSASGLMNASATWIDDVSQGLRVLIQEEGW